MKKRRSFLKSIASVTLGALALPVTIDAKPSQCQATSPDVQGPFYLSGSPERSKVAADNEPGEPLVISGKITEDDCQTAIINAKVEIWQASGQGVYDNTNQYKLRGFVNTDLNGQYSFETVYPGSYDNRPSHIHYRISALGFKTLVTQLYFTGDPLIVNDPFASMPSAKERIVPVTTDANNKKSCSFNIALAKNTSGILEKESAGYLVSTGPNPFSHQTQLSLSINQACEVLLAIYDSQGHAVKEIIHMEMPNDRLSVFWDGTNQDGSQAANGIYTAILYANHEKINHVKLVLQR